MIRCGLTAFKMVDVMAELEKRKGGKEMINLVVIGETLSGRVT